MDLQLFLNNELIDIDESVIAPLTYSIADVKNPNKRLRNRSKTITIKGTRRNLSIMFPAYTLTIDNITNGLDFNPNAELTARIIRNGTLVFNGVAQYLGVKLKGGFYYFDYQIFGTAIELFELLGEMTLKELDWSEYQHNLTISNLEDSWNVQVLKNGVPTSNFTGGVPDGFGYLYPLINWGYAGDQSKPKTNELIPLIYVKEAMEKCFAVGDYTITGSWITDTLTKKLVFGYGGGERILLSTAEQATRRSQYDGSSSLIQETITISIMALNVPGRAIYYYQLDYDLGDIVPFSTTLVNDSLLQYDETSGVYTCGRTGTYNIFYDFEASISKFQFRGGSFSGSQNKAAKFRISVIVNGFPRFSYTSSFKSTGTKSKSGQYQYSLNAGDEISFEVRLFSIGSNYVDGTSPQVAPFLEIDWTATKFNFDITALEVALTEGDVVDLGRWVPAMKCREFLTSMIVLNNLYISDPNDNNEIRIETFTSYYPTVDENENWTLKWDKSRETSIKSNAGIEGKEYHFKFAEDSDGYKELYFQKWGHHYGDYVYKVPTTFRKGEKEYKVGFAQTVPIDVGSLVIPQVVKIDPVTNSISPHKGKPRIFIYNGLQTGNWSLLNSSTGAATAELNYPQVHHVDNVASPTFDLNFGVPQEIYYTTNNYTTNNLFSVYYDRFIRELTSPEAKFLTAYFKLDESDFQGEFMSRLVNINGSVFRKNLISDFDATGYSTTKCELVKILDSNSKKTYEISLPPGYSDQTVRMSNNPSENIGVSTDVDTIINYKDSSTTLVNINPVSLGTVTLSTFMPNGTRKTIENLNGGDLTISTDGGIKEDSLYISGFEEINLSGAYARMTFVIYDNVWRIESSGGSSYINNVETSSISSDTTAEIGVTTYLCDTSSNDITVTLPIANIPNGKRWTFKKTSNNSNLFVKGISNGEEGFYEIDGDEDGVTVEFLNSTFTVEYVESLNAFKIVG